MAYDSDRDVIYKRTEQFVEKCGRSSINYNGIGIYPTEVGFCGEVYIGVKIKYKEKSYPEDKDISYYCYDKNKALDLINSENDNIIRPMYSYKIHDKYYRKHANREIEEAFTRINKSDIFTEYNCPIFVLKPFINPNYKKNLIINCELKQFEFQKVLDPYTAYQKLKTYVEGMAQPLRPIPELSDEVMQEIKGFDHKYSFRKEPRT
jgi:hypothetical protein